MNLGCAKRLGSIYYGTKSHIHFDTLYKHSLNFNSSSSNLDCRKQPRFLETNSVHSLIQTAGLEQGQFAEKGQRQRFLFMAFVKEHIRLYKSLKHLCLASLANL